MRKRRRIKYTWMPFLGQTRTVDTTEYGGSFLEFNVLAPQDYSPDLFIQPITADSPEENFTSQSRMVDVVGSEYFLRRLVGKIHLSYQQDNTSYTPGVGQPPEPPGVIVGAGFFVARAASTTDPVGGDNYPIGYKGVPGDVDDYNNFSPLARDTGREPWIWRRTWQLGNNIEVRSTAGARSGIRFFPATNASRSVLDGPHFDAKTARRIGSDDRLFFACAAQALSDGVTTAASAQGVVDGTLDLRGLIALRKARNKGTF